MPLTIQLAKSVQQSLLLKPCAVPHAISTLRNTSTHNQHEICSELMLPRCSKAALAQTPCWQKKLKEEEKQKGQKHHKWAIKPECCGDPCPNALPRFDDLYYKPSDKIHRNYTQTWVECPSKRIAKKVACDYKNFIYPEFEKRPRKKRRGGGSCKVKNDLGLMKCQRPPVPGPCPKFFMLGCKKVRDPPKCKIIKYPSGCKKICCPYPSFSECMKPRIRRRHPIECKCLDPIAMCDVWNEVKRREYLEATRLNVPSKNMV